MTVCVAIVCVAIDRIATSGAPRSLTETTGEPWRSYFGPGYETEQWTKAHEGERPNEVEAGNRGLKMDIKRGRPLDTLDATYHFRIEIGEAANINVIACASNYKINLHGPYLTLAIPEF
jgi:hypothetical protein